MSINAIGGITPNTAIAPTPGSTRTDKGGGATFGDALKSVIASVEDSTGEANQKIGQMLNGSGDVHEAMIAMQRADTMFQLTVQIRNKLVQAYQDVMRMSV